MKRNTRAALLRLEADHRDDATRRRHTLALVGVLFVELAIVLAICIAVAGCSAELVDDVEPCTGALGCECAADDECDGHGLGGQRGTCGPQDVCTIACELDDDCAELDDATCGPALVAERRVCTIGGAP